MYFNNIIGQEFAKKYITGIDGIGKNLFAKEFGKLLINVDNVDNSPDYINIEPTGSSIKIAQIRELQSDIIIKPHSKYKIYVINHAEKMTVESQNALLKTLEEPPEYAIIILITNNKESLLPTIKSRCEIIKFLPISIMELKRYLMDRGVEEKRSALLANFSRGSIEKALELSESSDFSIMRDDIQKYIQDILDKNMVEILNISSDMDKYKDKVIIVLDMMINYFRDIMICKDRADKDMLINGDRITFIQNMSSKITYSQVSKIIDIIEETKRKMRSNCNFSVSIQVMALNIYEVIK